MRQIDIFKGVGGAGGADRGERGAGGVGGADRGERGSGGVKRVFMAGIGGASMNGLAELLASMGYAVSGSDRAASQSTARLSARGVAVCIGHEAGNVDRGGAPDLVVHTAAVKMDNPELARAASLGVPIMTRAELLGRIMSAHGLSFAVAGSHGKSTTTAMLGEILIASGCDPTISVGADYPPIGGGMRVGGRAAFVAEACEYEDSFLRLRPTIAAITNIEYDHADYFRDLGHLMGSFAQFARQAGRNVVADAGDPNSAGVYWSLSEAERGKWLLFGVEAERGKWFLSGADADAGHDTGRDAGRMAERDAGRMAGAPFAALAAGVDAASHARPSFRLSLPRISGGGDAFGVGAKPANGGEQHCYDIELRTTGLYNIKNALAAAAAANAAGIAPGAIVEGLRRFRGVKKRFEYLGAAFGMDIVDDYAHHPSEIAPALAAARQRAQGAALWCVFQPHTYTRTKAFFGEFARAFSDATHVVLADIYAAREQDPGDISSELLAQAMRAEGVDALHIGGGFQAIAEHIAARGKPGDLIVTMGAGFASRVADILLSM